PADVELPPDLRRPTLPGEGEQRGPARDAPLHHREGPDGADVQVPGQRVHLGAGEAAAPAEALGLGKGRGLAVRRLAPLQKGRQLGRIDAGRWWVRNVGASAEARVGGTSPDVLVVLGVAAADRAVDAVHEPDGGYEETVASRGVHRGRGSLRTY